MGKNVATATVQVAKLLKKSWLKGSILAALLAFAASVPDYRRMHRGNCRHKLSDILMLTLFARLSGCTVRAEIIEFGRDNLRALRKLGMLRNGVPSEPTLCRVEAETDSAVMAEMMSVFAEAYNRAIPSGGGFDMICIDGKAMRGTTQENGRNPVIVSAYSQGKGIVLATQDCEKKSNEITAVPKLLDKINVSGKVVTADAMSMQKGIIDKIREKGGNFVIELKANQRSLLQGVEERVKGLSPVYSYTEEAELGHGRIETRTYNVYDGTGAIADRGKWGGVLTVIECVSVTVCKSTGQRTSERRLYVSSLPADTPNLGDLVRGHWSIESMHWSLDAVLKQDRLRRKSPKAARNLDTIQRIVYSVFSIWKGLRKKKSDKRLGMTELMRRILGGFTKLLRFLSQK